MIDSEKKLLQSIFLKHSLVSEEDYEEYFEEEEVSYSMAKRSKVKGRGSLMVGALARLNIKFDQLSLSVKKLAQEVGLRIPDYNPFHNNLAQSLEVLYGIQECRQILENLKLSPEDNNYRVRAEEGGAFSSFQWEREGRPTRDR